MEQKVIIETIDEEQIKISTENPDRIYVCEDGRIAHLGVIYKNEKEFKQTTEMILKFLKVKKKVKTFFRLK